MMKKILLPSVPIAAMMLAFSCTDTDPKDPMKLYAEIDRKADPNTITGKETGKGWQLLFDGQTTSGWHGYNMTSFPEAWAIEDGSLTMNTTGGAESLDIVTEKEYGSFALSLEYKLTTAANSGIIFHINEDTLYKFPYETGPEMQVIDQVGWNGPLEDWQSNGANYAMYPPLVRPYKPVGEWNQVLLVVDGNKVTQILNGEIVVKYEKYSEEWNKLRNSGKWTDFPDWGKSDSGHISLQNHGTKVWYRSIKLKEL